jgi:chemotaxis protein MotB
MAASRGKRRRGAAAEHENEERWLLTYADMITLLMALFMVLFSIANVNKAKLEALSKSLNEAFSGKIMPGGRAIQTTGAEDKGSKRPAPTPPIPAITPLVAQATSEENKAAAQQEQDDFTRIKRQIDAYASSHGLKAKVETTITQRGLVIRLLTDKVLFDSGQAILKPQADPILSKVSNLLGLAGKHDVMVEGHTDNVPIHGQYPTNWELSTARASTVVRYLIGHGAVKMRMAASGYAALHPIADNASASGRSRNRRVEIVLLRSKAGADIEQGGSTP